ncbi:hypothetical protein CLAFUR4_05202 [Fulvia fulva]|nr:hypothetical protein CLAFUR4_05202 [Fulvia fulva]WPV28605.1 hypothetical protein CLAFUW7_05212 [Fulvia fulva]
MAAPSSREEAPIDRRCSQPSADNDLTRPSRPNLTHALLQVQATDTAFSYKATESAARAAAHHNDEALFTQPISPGNHRFEIEVRNMDFRSVVAWLRLVEYSFISLLLTFHNIPPLDESLSPTLWDLVREVNHRPETLERILFYAKEPGRWRLEHYVRHTRDLLEQVTSTSHVNPSGAELHRRYEAWRAAALYDLGAKEEML